ncbi:ATP-binding protein [Streptacidiphilus sp. PAMC 29251]
MTGSDSGDDSGDVGGLPAAPLLLDWAARTDAGCPRLCLVTGGRGSGKSRLLAWLLASSVNHPLTTIHATVPASGQTARTLAWEIGRQLGYGPLDPAALLARLAADPRPVRMLIPDLHRSGRGPADLPAARPETAFTELVLPMLALPQVRIAVEVDRRDLLPSTDGAAEALLLELPAGPSADAGHDESLDAEPLPPTGDWRTAGARLRENALDQALAHGTAARLLADPGFLVHGSAVAITAVLADERITAPRRLREVWESAGPVLAGGGLDDRSRAAVLHAAALGHDPLLAEFLRPLAETSAWTAVWSHPALHTAAATLLGDDLVLADPAGRLQRHDPATGALIARISTDPLHPVTRMTAVSENSLLTADAQGRLAVLCTDPQGTLPIAVSRLAQRHNAAALADPEAAATAVACSLADDSRPLAVADARGGFQLRSTGPAAPEAAEPRGGQLHRSPVSAVAVLSDPGSSMPDLVLTGGLDGSVRLWDSRSGSAMPEPVERRNAVPTALAITDSKAGPVLAVAWSDRLLHLWQLFEGRLVVLPLLQDAHTLTLTSGGLLSHGGPQGTGALRLDLEALWG